MSANDCANNSTTQFINSDNNNCNNNSYYNNNHSHSNVTSTKINKSLIAHIANLPGFDASKARIVKQSCYNSSGTNSNNTSYNNSQVGTPILPTAAETFLPWRRDRSYQAFGRCFLTLSLSIFL